MPYLNLRKKISRYFPLEGKFQKCSLFSIQMIRWKTMNQRKINCQIKSKVHTLKLRSQNFHSKQEKIGKIKMKKNLWKIHS